MPPRSASRFLPAFGERSACISCIPTSSVTSLAPIERRVKARFCAICGHCCFVVLLLTKFTRKSIFKMSQLHQEALRRQHVVDKRNVNDFPWLVSYNYNSANHTISTVFLQESIG